MFSGITAHLRIEIETLKRVLDTHDKFRTLLFQQPDGATVVLTGEPVKNAEIESGERPGDRIAIEQIRTEAPGKSSWQVYDHCAAFTRLYAVYEHFIEELVSEYLSILPTLYPRYEDLPTGVSRQHRIGVGQILLKFGKDGPYKEFQEQQIIEGLFHGLSGQTVYTLLADAFFIDPQNYRADAVVKLFSYVGLQDCWPWVEKHPVVRAFMLQARDTNETPKTLLHDFIEYRNKASHTNVVDIVALEEIKSIADFLLAFSEALEQLLTKQVVQRKSTLGELLEVGIVLHKFSGNIIGARMLGGHIAIGEELIVVEKNACFLAKILSIKVHAATYETLQVIDGQEVGIKFNVEIREGAQLVRLRPHEQSALPLVEPPPEAISPDEELSSDAGASERASMGPESNEEEENDETLSS
jgi:hypothetical protein